MSVPGVMEAGSNEQVNPLGNWEQFKFMALLKAPDCGTAVTVTFPEPPDAIVRDEGLVPKDRVG